MVDAVDPVMSVLPADVEVILGAIHFQFFWRRFTIRSPATLTGQKNGNLLKHN